MAIENQKNIIHSTKEGRLYIEISDFFGQEKIQQTIKELMNSDIIKKIEERKRKGNQAA
jgi:chromosome segregation and condensation protein ScpB